MPALLAAWDRIGTSLRYSRTTRIRSRRAFKTLADSFRFLRGQPPARPCLRPVFSSGVVSVSGSLVSLVAASALRGSSVCVDPLGAFSFTGVASDAGWYGGQELSAQVS